jgi:hypothetical protein
MNGLNETAIQEARKQLQKEIFRHPIKNLDIMGWYAGTIVFVGLLVIAHYLK